MSITVQITPRECLEVILGRDFETKYPSVEWAMLTARTLIKLWSEKRDLSIAESTFRRWYDEDYLPAQ